MDENSNLEKYNFLKKLIVVFVLAVFAILFIKLCFHDADAALEKYDYSQVSTVPATVLYTDSYYDTGHSSKTVHLMLENGKEISIGIGGASSPSDGEHVILYTDGHDYSFTERGVAIDNTKGYFANIFVPCLLIFALIMFIINYIKGMRGVVVAVGTTILIFIMIN